MYMYESYTYIHMFHIYTYMHTGMYVRRETGRSCDTDEREEWNHIEIHTTSIHKLLYAT